MRILIVRAYEHTGSVLLAQLLHASFTGFLVLLSPLAVSPAQESLWYGCYALVLWAAATAMIILTCRRPPGTAPAPVPR